MTSALRTLGIESWPREDQLSLVHDLWNHIAATGGSLLTDSQRDELKRRATEDDADPNGGIPWEQVKAETLERLRP